VEIVRLTASIVSFLLAIYSLILLARLVLEFIPMFNREWRPRGFGLVLAELIFTVTDPPIRLFRRLIPPLRIGPVALDVGLTLTFLIVLVLSSIANAIARS